MSFTSLEFVFIALPVAVTGFWLCLRLSGPRAAAGWLVCVSMIMYLRASALSFAIILPSILFDYAVIRYLLRIPDSRPRLRRTMLTVGIGANVLLLGYFKYKNFFLDTLDTVLASHLDLTPVILPIGISFLVFQKINLLTDVYVGEVEHVDFLEYSVFSLFYPRAVAGPIVRYNEIVPQLKSLSADRFRADLAVGICLFSIGMFKKTVIADGVGGFVPDLFDPPTHLTSAAYSPPWLTCWVGVLSFALQLYFDFSGYSDMALGVARMVGVRLPMNFFSPFKSSSIIEFWSHWNMTLTRFLTSQIYTPMALALTRRRMRLGQTLLRGRKSGLSAIGALIVLPTMTTMAVSGLWHGAGWTFVFYGLLHGAYLSINQIWRLFRYRIWSDHVSYERVMRPLGVLLTFSAVVASLVLFRSSTLAGAGSIFRGLIGLNGLVPSDVQLLRDSGIRIPDSLISMLLPTGAPPWLLLLLLVVFICPNSSELLRRFRPTLDFPNVESGVDPGKSEPRASSRWLGWTMLTRPRRNGVPLNTAIAILIAVMGVLGLMAITQGGSFVYGAF